MHRAPPSTSAWMSCLTGVLLAMSSLSAPPAAAAVMDGPPGSASGDSLPERETAARRITLPPADASPDTRGALVRHAWPVAAGLAAAFLLDSSAREYVQERRSGTTDDLADLARPAGEWRVYATVPAGILAAGLVSGDPAWREAGLRIATAVALTGGLSPLLKHSIGRMRPERERGPDAYDPFSHSGSLPSGHTAMAFALATGISLEARRAWVTGPAYGFAALTGWSRLNDDRHWLSDVVAGALMGHLIARLAHDRIRWNEGTGPVLWSRGRDAGVGWRAGF